MMDYIEIKIPAKPDYIGVIRLTLSGICNRIGYTYEEIEDIKIAVSEPAQMLFSMPIQRMKMEK